MLNTLGQRIRSERQARAWTQKMLSVKAFGSEGRASDITYWERDKRVPSLDNLQRLARAFQIRAADLIPDSEISFADTVSAQEVQPA